VTKLRGIDLETLNRITDKLEVSLPEDALEHGFVDSLMHLFAVSVRHFGKYIGLDGALVLAGRGAENLGLDVELVEQPRL